MGCQPEVFWRGENNAQLSTILKAIRNFPGKPKCQMGVQYEYQRQEDTFYIRFPSCWRYTERFLCWFSSLMRRLTCLGDGNSGFSSISMSGGGIASLSWNELTSLGSGNKGVSFSSIEAGISVEG
jgi:hypothetical protein